MAPPSTSFLRTHTLAFLQQQIISEILQGGNELSGSLVDTLLKPRASSGKEKAAAALTGLMRSDAGMLRQASRNVQEGSSVASMALEGTKALSKSIQRMIDIAQQVADDPGLETSLTPEFNSLKQTIAGKVEGTKYNGISLMDKGGWGDERVNWNGVSDNSSISIQSGESARPLSLRDFSSMSDDINALDLTPANISNTITDLTTKLGTVDLQSALYKDTASGFTSDAKSLERQADILTSTAARAETAALKNPRSLLLHLILGDQGNIFDQSL